MFVQPHEHDGPVFMERYRTLPATGFLGFLCPQKHSAATQPVQEAVAALPIESSQRTLTHRTVTKASTEPNQQPGQSPVVDH